jgi:hypothetical protein
VGGGGGGGPPPLHSQQCDPSSIQLDEYWHVIFSVIRRFSLDDTVHRRIYVMDFCLNIQDGFTGLIFSFGLQLSFAALDVFTFVIDNLVTPANYVACLNGANMFTMVSNQKCVNFHFDFTHRSHGAAGIRVIVPISSNCTAGSSAASVPTTLQAIA